MGKYKRYASKKKEFRRNEQIHATEVSVIDEKDNQLGILATADALREAKSRGYDLVEVSPLAKPPVCKIVNYGQLQYEKSKKERKQKSKQKKTEIKGIRLSTTISEHDMGVRVDRARKFLEKGHKVQMELLLRGRQKAHPEIGEDVMKKFISELDEVSKVESPVSRKGGKFIALIIPKNN
ncbi:MAG: translation initiation factor IF-3 [bacterium]|nr:translation initiation factor IF-3 [bacterium]